MTRSVRPLVLVLAAALLGAVPLADAAPPPPRLLDTIRAQRPLAATLDVALPADGLAVPGTPLRVTGHLVRTGVQDGRLTHRGAAGTLRLQVRLPGGQVRGPFAPVTTDRSGRFTATLPAAATRGIRAGAQSGFEAVAGVEVVDARAGDTHAPLAGTAAVPLAAAAAGDLQVHNSFVSAVGWVKPGDTYPFRVLVRNTATSPTAGGTVTVASVDGMRFTAARVAIGAGSVTQTADEISWTVGTVPAATDAGPGLVSLVVEARADGTADDPQIVWKDLSTTAVLDTGAATAQSRSRGPKVIPPDERYDTARYGDRPFPVVPVDYVDRKHRAESTAEGLSNIINSPSEPGSTFNLYQEMSYGQLFPNGTVPSAGKTGETFSEFEFTNPKYTGGFAFTTTEAGNTCVPGVDATLADVPGAVGSPAFDTRIQEGWYQLPGTTGYYGRDGNASAIIGSLTGVGALHQIDSGCGSNAKVVYDAAHIADPEVDYSDYDTDKDGVVDFFMMIFAGLGGHGVSQGLGCDADPPDSATDPNQCPFAENPPGPYDNVWPHSSSLEFYYTDQATGLTGYVTDDQLKDLEDRPLYYTDQSRSAMTTTATELPVYVRVGPYNVNPESSLDKASVISHEYGHSLGLPDFYSTSADRTTYGDWNLMATDKSQHMDVFGKQEMGWLVPRVITNGLVADGWRDSKIDTHRIDWTSPDGTPYTLSGPQVHNGEGYSAKLPGRILIDPQMVADGASPSHVWWSGAGSDYLCPPEKGHNLDIALPELAALPEGTPVTLSFKTHFDIEWDYDYGFVLVSEDGESYSSLPSQNGYTTATSNPNANSCQTRYGNGITGTNASYDAGTAPVDRTGVGAEAGQDPYPPGGFSLDEYDLSSLVGAEAPVLRFGYSTDPALNRPGWFIDDVEIKAGDRVIYRSDFESSGTTNDPRIYNGGCKDATKVAKFCTPGWIYVSSDEASTADHGYYLEMRERSGFDYDGKGENDRTPIAFQPGLLLTYTDESRGYGNAGMNDDEPPAQHPLDAAPTPGEVAPGLNDAAFGTDQTFDDSTHVDNYQDPTSESGNWEFHYNCLKFAVEAMDGDTVDASDNTAVGIGGDLTGRVRFRTGPGCAAFDYGYGGARSGAGAPVAVAAAKPSTVRPSEHVTFDGSASYDDAQASRDLRYEWDFTTDGTVDARTQVARHAYPAEGRYTATLRVTDADGGTATDTVVVVVDAAAGGRPRPGLPATGGAVWPAVTGLVAVAAAALLRRRGRAPSGRAG